MGSSRGFLMVFSAVSLLKPIHLRPQNCPAATPSNCGCQGAMETRVGSVEEEVLRKFQVTDREVELRARVNAVVRIGDERP